MRLSIVRKSKSMKQFQESLKKLITIISATVIIGQVKVHGGNTLTLPGCLAQKILSVDKVEDDSVEQTNHLRSANEIEHYGVDALDGKKGYIKDFIWDTYNWSLRYLVIDTRDWLPGGKKVLISPDQFDTLNWGSKTVTCNINLAQIKACPEYCPDKLNDVKHLEQTREPLQNKK